MRLIHTADLHLDAPAEAHLPPERAKERRNELLLTFRRMVDFAAENHVDGILIAGDLFDRKSVSKTAANTVIHAILSHPEILFFYLRGNHDEGGFLGRFEEIPKNLKTFSDSWTTYPVGCGPVRITGAELSKENTAVYDTLYLDHDAVNIVMLHGQESESGSSSDAEAVRLKALRNRHIDYLALGHIHQFRYAELDGRGVFVYPGCPEGHGFDECGEKGFVLLDVDEEEKTIDFRFVPFCSRRLYEIRTDVTGALGTADVIDRVNQALDQENVAPSSMVKIVLTGSYDAESEKDDAMIEAVFKDQYYAFYAKDETAVSVDYKKYRLDESLKGEFVRLVEESALPEEEKSKIIRTGILALRGEELFS